MPLRRPAGGETSARFPANFTQSPDAKYQDGDALSFSLTVRPECRCRRGSGGDGVRIAGSSSLHKATLKMYIVRLADGDNPLTECYEDLRFHA